MVAIGIYGIGAIGFAMFCKTATFPETRFFVAGVSQPLRKLVVYRSSIFGWANFGTTLRVVNSRFGESCHFKRPEKQGAIDH